MDTVTIVLLVFLGIGVGSGVTYFYARIQIRQLLVHVNTEKARRDDERKADRATDQETINELKAKLDIAEAEAARFQQEWQAEKKQREIAEEGSTREVDASMMKTIEAKDRAMGKLLEEIATLKGKVAAVREVESSSREMEASMTKTIEAKDRAMGKLLEENSMLKGRVAELEQALEEQKNNIDDGLVFVHGNHYLPGSVIRSLTRKKESK